MPKFKGNRGNLLQHWVLAELIAAIRDAVHDGSRLCYIDAHSMSPYAVRDDNPGQSANDFDRVRACLPGRSSSFEVAWQALGQAPDCEYPSSAAFVRQLWTGPLHVLLCEYDRATASEIAQWIGTLDRSNTSWELFRGDWHVRFRQAFVTDHDVYMMSFDPYMFDRNGPPAQPRPGNMYPPDLLLVRHVVDKLPNQPIVIQLSTYSANNSNSQSDVAKAIAPTLLAAGMSITNIVVADGNMMSLVFSRNLEPLARARLSERFADWITQTAAM